MKVNRLHISSIGLALMSFLILGACKDDKKSPFQKYVKLKETAANSKTKRDSALLGFRFGMSSEEVDGIFDSLNAAHVISTDSETKNFTYSLKTGQSAIPEVRCSMIPRYQDGKLYEFILLGEDYSTNPLYSIKLATTILKGVVLSKYGGVDARYDLIGQGEETWVWFKNNVEVSVYEHVDGPIIKYTDLSREKLKEDADKIKLDHQKNETKNQL